MSIAKTLSILLLFFLLSCSVVERKDTGKTPLESFGWDLSYESILKKNSIARDDWLAKWVKSRQSLPIQQIISAWEHTPITSSILLEQPAFHAGEQLAFWFVGSTDSAYLWIFLHGERKDHKPIDFALYDSLLNTVADWQQKPPLVNDKAPSGTPGGYFGFLSIYNRGAAKQILLNIDEFYNLEDPNWETADHGRVIKAFKPLLGYW